jgi:D-alanine-D-alanine ligase
MDVVILHPAVAADAAPEDQDTLVQVRLISEGLAALGHRPIPLACTLDFAALRRELAALAPGKVFNLVESVEGADSLQHLPTAVLDALGIPYTGNSTEAIFQTTHKLLAKQLLDLAGLPTPRWLAAGGGWKKGTQGVPGPHLPERPEGGHRCAALVDAQMGTVPFFPPLRPPCILKAVWEHASRGLDEENVLQQGDAAEVQRRLAEYAARIGRPCFAEQFVEGREFNLAVLDGPRGPEPLPPAEIDFSAFPPGKPRIVGHRAKWIEGSFEFANTPRRFDFPGEDRPLLDRLRDLTLAVCRLFSLRGYARVDFRVDRSGQPWILEINTNPCLSPDAGFAAALDRAGIPPHEAIRRILVGYASA